MVILFEGRSSMNTTLKLGYIIGAIATIILLGIFVIYSLKRTKSTIHVFESIVLYADQSLPGSFCVSSEFDTPPRYDNFSWFGAVTDYLESSYRYFGHKNQFLSNNNYVRFSSLAFKYTLNKLMQEQLNMTIYNANFSFVAATFLKLNLIPHLQQSVFPDSLCTKGICPDLTKYIANSPLSFEISEQRWVRSVADIKQLLYENDYPFLFTIPEPLIEYTLPCSDHRIADEKACYKENMTCPSSYREEKCHHSTFTSANLSTFEYFLPKPPVTLKSGNLLTGVIIGWNDDHMASVGGFDYDYINPSQGGFIVKLTKGVAGNTIGYYDGTLSIEKNNELCGSMSNPFNWNESTILECIDENYCNKSFQYQIIKSEKGKPISSSDNYGYSSTKMLRIGSDNQKEIFDFDALPVIFINKAFIPKNISKNESNIAKEQCSYWFLPYDVIEQLTMLNSNTDSVHALQATVKWAKNSYQRSASGGKYDEISKSTCQMSSRIATNDIE